MKPMTLIDDVLTQVRKTNYPFQNENQFHYYIDIIRLPDRKLYEYVVKFPVAGILLKDKPYYENAGIIKVEFPEWLEMYNQEYQYYDNKSKYKSMLAAIQLIIETEMKLL